MTAFIATYPPLGQVTQLPDRNGSLTIHAVLQVPTSLSAASWEVALWHSGNADDETGGWTETKFAPSPPDDRPVDVHTPGDGATRLYFRADVTVKKPSLAFTVKFRCLGPWSVNDGGEWRWVRSEQGSEDGVAIIDRRPTQHDDPETLPDLIRDLNPALKWRGQLSQAPGTRLWLVHAPVDAAKEDVSTVVDVPLGVPWGRFLRWFALVRNSAAWLAPRHGKSTFHLDKDALLCSFLSPEGKHLVFLGMSGIGDVVTLFRSGESGRLMLHLRNDGDKPDVGTVLVAVGDSLETAIAAVMYHARALVKPTGVVVEDSGSPSPTPTETTDDDAQPLWYENWYDGLGYCTWNSLGQDLTADKVLHALDMLAENKIQISSLIIDDNWQDLARQDGGNQWKRTWDDFDADPQGFPDGLRGFISQIQSRHKSIHHIAVWHALLGYWGGINPSGPLAQRYPTISIPRHDPFDPSTTPSDSITVISPSSISRFYNDFYTFLSARGITGVKTDAQYMLDTLLPASARRTLLPAYLNAWILASARHFPGYGTDRAIACMAHGPPALLFRGPLARAGSRSPPPWRNSDDYAPDGSAEAHAWHVWANAHNALLAQHLGVLPDWDMFQTVTGDGREGEWGGFHAAARCVSGGPVCITDVPGRHDVKLLRQVTGRTPRGATVVFRPSVVGRAVARAQGYRGFREGGPALLKVGAFHGRGGTGTGIVGVFSLTTGAGSEERGEAAGTRMREVVEMLALEDFPGTGKGRRYVVRSHRTGKVTPPLEVVGERGENSSPPPLVTVALGPGGYDVLSAYPLTEFISSRTSGGGRREVLLANLGLVDKMTGCAAVLRAGFEARENGTVVVDATLKALGVLGIYISVLPELSLMDDFMVAILGQPVPPHTVSVCQHNGHILEVDMERAWDEMGLDSGWANEAQVKIYFPLEKR